LNATGFAPALARRLDLWPTGGVVPFARNARAHSPEQAAQIAVRKVSGGVRANLSITSPPDATRREYDATSRFRPVPPNQSVAWHADVPANVAAVLAPGGQRRGGRVGHEPDDCFDYRAVLPASARATISVFSHAGSLTRREKTS